MAEVVLEIRYRRVRIHLFKSKNKSENERSPELLVTVIEAGTRTSTPAKSQLTGN